MKKLLTYLLLIIGVLILFYQEAFLSKENNKEIYICVGLSVLISGVYRLSKKLSSKDAYLYSEPMVITEKETQKTGNQNNNAN